MGQIFNLTKSAELANVSRMTLVRHIQKGKLSSTIDEHGKKGVEVSELIRCYGELKNVDTGVTSTSDSTGDTSCSNNRCDEIIHGLKERVRKLEDTNDRYLKMIESSVYRIEDKSGSGKKPKKGKKPKPKKGKGKKK
jgi:hypothetical protein